MYKFTFSDIYEFSDFLLGIVNLSVLDISGICEFDLAYALVSNLCQDDKTSFASVDLENEFIGCYNQDYLVRLDSDFNIGVRKLYFNNKEYAGLNNDETILLHKGCNNKAAIGINRDNLFLFSLSDIDGSDCT